MIFGSLFSGIGGIDLGLERAGMRGAWQVEIDPFCRRVLERHWPGVPRHDDIRTFDPTTGEPVDLVAGGFPCQPVSCAGKRRGEADPRWMWPEFLRVVRTCRPAWVLVENVLGLRTRGADRVLGDLEAEGYAIAPLVVGARHVGAPHRRDRVWIVAHANGPAVRKQCGGREAGTEETVDRHDGAHGDVPNADSLGLRSQRALPARKPHAAQRGQGPDTDGWRFESVRLAEHAGEQGTSGIEPDGLGAAGCGSRSPMGDANGEGLAQRTLAERSPFSRRGAATSGAGWWDAEPDVGRVAHGVPARVDRLRALGNAVVPQVVAEIGRAILHANETLRQPWLTPAERELGPSSVS